MFLPFPVVQGHSTVTVTPGAASQPLYDLIQNAEGFQLTRKPLAVTAGSLRLCVPWNDIMFYHLQKQGWDQQTQTVPARHLWAHHRVSLSPARFQSVPSASSLLHTALDSWLLRHQVFFSIPHGFFGEFCVARWVSAVIQKEIKVITHHQAPGAVVSKKNHTLPGRI